MLGVPIARRTGYTYAHNIRYITTYQIKLLPPGSRLGNNFLGIPSAEAQGVAIHGKVGSGSQPKIRVSQRGVRA
eukprot:11174900-Lingulodinium_polyedra.AAC.1